MAGFERFARTTMAAALVVMATGACTRLKDHKGFVIDKTLADAVQTGIDNKDSVQRTLGRPTFVSQFDPNVWYYISRDTKALAFRNPTPYGQYILTVQFDPAGNVANVAKTGVDKVVAIRPNGDRTPTLGRDRGFFKELFGNIGTLGTSQGGGTADNPE